MRGREKARERGGEREKDVRAWGGGRERHKVKQRTKEREGERKRECQSERENADMRK